MCWLLAAFLVPLAVNPWGSSAFELPKAALLLGLALSAGLLALHRVIQRPATVTPIGSPSPLIWPALAFGAVLILATLFSTNPTLSLWGSHARRQGLLTQLSGVGLFAAVALGLHTRAQANRLLAALVWGSLPVVAYGLWQAAAPDPLGWQTDAASPLVATLGRPNFLASYLVLTIPLTLGRLLQATRRWSYALLLAGQLACLALTGARSGWLGLAAVALAFGVAWLIGTGRARLALGIATAAAAAAITVAGVVLVRGDEGSASARMTIWRAGLPLVVQRPGLGYGPETTRAAFAPVYPPQLVYYQGRDVVVDRAHNLWLDLALTAGAAGVAASGALLAVTGRQVWRGLQAADRSARLTWAALAAALIGHLADMQAGVETVAGATLAWLLLGLAAALARGLSPSDARIQRQDAKAPRRQGAKAPRRKNSWNLCVLAPSRLGVERTWLPLVAPALVTAALIGMLCVRPLLADAAAWQALATDRPADERQAAAERAVALWPVSTEYRRLLADRYLAGGDLTAAERQLAAATALEPADAVVWALQGDLYASHGHPAAAEAAYRHALALAPTIGLTHRGLGLVLLQQGRTAEGIAALERAVDLDATDGVAFYHLAEAYRAQGDEAGAARAWRQALRWGF